MKEKGVSSAVVIAIVVIIAAVVAGGYFLLKGEGEGGTEGYPAMAISAGKQDNEIRIIVTTGTILNPIRIFMFILVIYLF